MDKAKKVFVVPHSHWDREWYFTIEDSNVLLCENLEYLINVLEKNEDFKSYVFDGQISIIEEFLNIYPEKVEKITNLIKNKRLLVGPWYTQTDTLLVNKESIIRNLLYGTKIGQEMGYYMKIGYLPDVFGQNSYLPSIFEGFGIEYAVVQRGIYEDQLKGDLNFIWQSPDGKRIKTNNIYLGYGPGKFLSSESDYVNTELLPILEKLSKLNKNSNNILLPAGGDQVLVNKNLPKVIKEINSINSNYYLMLSDYEEFMKETWKDSNFSNVIEGELIACQNSRIHNTIRSQRYDIKSLNNIIENKILYILEPLCVIGKSLGIKYPSKLIDNIWKKMFDVHAHDSICGCNSDETNTNILIRLNKVNNTIDCIINILKKQLTYAISKGCEKEEIFVVFNTMPHSRNINIKTILYTKNKDFGLFDLNKNPINFDVIEQNYVSGGKKIVVTAEGEKEIEIEGYYRNVLNVEINDIPSMGYATFIIEDNIKLKNCRTMVTNRKLSNKISNELYEIKCESGELSLLYKVTNKKLKNFIIFEEQADDGDSYDFSPLEGDKPLYIKNARVMEVYKGDLVQIMKVSHTINLPLDIEKRKNKDFSHVFSIETTFELRKGENFIRVKHEIDNNIMDHRVRVIFNTDIKNIKYSYVDQGFSVIKHNIENPYFKDWASKEFVEAPVSIYPLENFAAITDEKSNFAVITKGIKEYEAFKDGRLALTLFRSVGVLGKDNIAWRPGRASGINNKVVYTPKAQLLKRMEFEYAVFFEDSSFEPGKIFKVSYDFIEHFAVYQKQSLNIFHERLEKFQIPLPIEKLPSVYSLFSIDNDRVFISCCKLAHEKDGIIVRVFNPSEIKQDFNIKYSKNPQITFVNLFEDEIKTEEGKIKVNPKSYVTLKIKSIEGEK
ncbi:glycoside hydrolase family 38 C-terminal domain-containing protein [Anaerobranca gottschalkii]|uniref:Alpha-mannosidase n=1 Tax=Anaerobranca gottschalkii DSM 13577 TaxID=1120990 RepID=A0A1I0CBG3_9FIRM|nr:glycoside hydrolase family 38 C-terminal domain-containing protein [Anaerobranca gottschalkii]SET16782.1 alpha-mannosidase [Anaerobranca gottschalkii DSM 13577]